ncbi:MAG: DUF4350 domain-containing protein [Candidatus Thiodiazotropha sp.]
MQSNRIATVAVIFLLVSLLGFTGYWFYNNYERVEEEVRTGQSAEARRNPWLAAEQLLDRLGLRVESRSGRRYLTSPPETVGVLFVRDLGAPLPQARQDALLAWAKGGGHLVLSPGLLRESDTDHSLLARFGITLESSDATETETQDGTDQPDDTENGSQSAGDRNGDAQTGSQPGSGTDTATCKAGVKRTDGHTHPDTQDFVISLPDSEESLHIGFDPDRWFTVDSDYEHWEAPGDEAPNLLVFPWGSGRVTFLSDDRFWDNDRIGDQDHALLLARLADGYDRAWLLYSSQMPSLLRLLWSKAPYLLTGLGLFTLLLLWWMTRRTGPRLYRAYDQRRDLLEHLQAAAEFAWRTNSSSGLLENARRQVERRWLSSHPRLQHLAQPARCQWLADRTGMTAQRIEQALYGNAAEGAQLIKNTTILQRLMSALHPQSGKR